MCDKCNITNNRKFCSYCGHELLKHCIDFYTCFDKGLSSCYQTMTNLPGISCADGNGNKFHVDIPTKREKIYKYLGNEP